METVSELIYTPKTERDYGTLACWGKNSIGKQSEPCLFQVVPAGKTKEIMLIAIGYKFLDFFKLVRRKFYQLNFSVLSTN